MSGGEPETVKRVVTHMSTATHSQELILDDKNLDMTSTTDLFELSVNCMFFLIGYIDSVSVKVAMFDTFVFFGLNFVWGGQCNQTD